MKKRRRISPRSLVEGDPLAPDHFTWTLAANGYRWEQHRCFRSDSNASPQERWVLSPPHPSEPTRDYNPLTVPELFRTFADSGFGKDDALRFVNKFGLLGLKKWELWDRMDGFRSVYCEQLGDWGTEVLAMRAAVRVRDALESGSEKRLADLIVRFSELEPSLAKSCETFAKPTATPSADDWILKCRGDDWIDFVRLSATEADDRNAAAWSILYLMANDRLSQHCSAILHRRTPKSSMDRPVLRVTPKSLLGAMWWQFGRVLAGESSYRKCKACPVRFEISAGAHGKPVNREFCSDACRTRDNRRKVREARELKAKGRTVQQIAKHFETSNDTINNWLTKKK